MGYELHWASPPSVIFFSKSGTSLASSRTNTWKPNPLNISCRFICSSRGFFPGAFTSTKAIFPSGRRTIRSGIPENDGDTNFNAMPPHFFVSVTSFSSICFSFKKVIRYLLRLCNHFCINWGSWFILQVPVKHTQVLIADFWMIVEHVFFCPGPHFINSLKDSHEFLSIRSRKDLSHMDSKHSAQCPEQPHFSSHLFVKFSCPFFFMDHCFSSFTLACDHRFLKIPRVQVLKVYDLPFI
uniref:Uncharacterized protein n=1 Tax=Siphoviridae sp. ctm7X10 TaxID=2827929 RepID=A0A8S5S564_9CAUD|nr:MAG TPA: hypothetical protein [Siphoviridae sp. ctm7X10]